MFQLFDNVPAPPQSAPQPVVEPVASCPLTHLAPSIDAKDVIMHQEEQK